MIRLTSATFEAVLTATTDLSVHATVFAHSTLQRIASTARAHLELLLSPLRDTLRCAQLESPCCEIRGDVVQGEIGACILSLSTTSQKSTKKGVHIPGVKGESLFKTPDNPYGRGKPIAAWTPVTMTIRLIPIVPFTVGVTGSGKGMTSYAAKQRVKFTGAEGSGEQQP